MFEKILVCLDGSELAEQILPYATEQALRFGSTLTLFHVLTPPATVGLNIPGAPAVEVETTGMFHRLEKHSGQDEKYFQYLADKIAESGVRVDYEIQVGDPGQAIIDYTAANGIGLIAIATHGRGGLGRAFFGSVADYVLRHSSLPVLLVRSKPG